MFGIFIFERKVFNLLLCEHIEILTVNGELLFFRQREGPFYLTLRLLHNVSLVRKYTFGNMERHERRWKLLSVVNLLVLGYKEYKTKMNPPICGKPIKCAFSHYAS